MITPLVAGEHIKLRRMKISAMEIQLQLLIVVKIKQL